MRAGNNGTLAQALDEADSAEAVDSAFASRHRHQEGEHGVDEHAPAEEPQSTVFLGQYAERNLRDHIAIEEGGQYIALDTGTPSELAIFSIVLRERESKILVIDQ